MTDTASRRARLIADLTKLGFEEFAKDAWEIPGSDFIAISLRGAWPAQRDSAVEWAEKYIAPLLAIYERGDAAATERAAGIVENQRSTASAKLAGLDPDGHDDELNPRSRLYLLALFEAAAAIRAAGADKERESDGN